MIETVGYPIHQIPDSERPRERMMQVGEESLSSIELLAIILGSGTKANPVMSLAQEIMIRFGSLQSIAAATISELCEIKGVGEAKAIQLKAAFTLGLRASKKVIEKKHKIFHPSQAFHLVKDEFKNQKREIFLVILLDVKGCVICHEVVSIGTLSSSLVHPREVFYPAIRHKAASLILVHNHPSEDLTPSPADCHTTEQLIEVGHMIKIPIHDHLIIGSMGFYSFRQSNILKSIIWG